MELKGKICKRISLLIRSRAVGRMEQMRLMAFLLGAALGLFGMPFHFLFNWLGHGMPVLHAISFAIWLSYVVIVGLFFSRRLNLEKSFFSLAVCFQTLTSLRIVYLAATATPAVVPLHHEQVILNEALSFTCFLITCMGMVRNAPTAVFALLVGALVVGYVINPAVVMSQFVLLFLFVMFCVWGYAMTMRILFNDATREINDYKQLQDSILDMFNMSKTEMVSLVQLCRTTGNANEVDRKIIGKLTEQTLHNLVRLGQYMSNEKQEKLEDLSDRLPQLTPTELEVCRLVLKGMSQKEIAVAMNKSQSNIGTVRGNIRRKLGLGTNEELKDELVRRMN